MSTSDSVTGGAMSVARRSAMARNSFAAGPVAVERHRSTFVVAGGDGGFDRDPPDERCADRLGQRLAAALAEQRIRLAVLALERAHVLDDADDREEAAARHVGRPLGDLLRGRARAW